MHVLQAMRTKKVAWSRPTRTFDVTVDDCSNGLFTCIEDCHIPLSSHLAAVADAGHDRSTIQGLGQVAGGLPVGLVLTLNDYWIIQY